MRVIRQCATGMRMTLDALVAATLAPPCAACDRPLDHPLDGPVCEPCWSSVRPLRPPLCRTCGDALPSWRAISLGLERCPRCRRGGVAIDRGAAAGEYDGALRDIVHAFKYGSRRSLAVRLGDLMRTTGAGLLSGADIAVPVPLHWWRQLRRGFNQADDLARALGLPVVRVLRRTRATSPQSDLRMAERGRNVRRAFAVTRTALRERTVEGLVVVLVDDVSTTGATLDACARALKNAGALEVRALTAARAVRVGARTDAPPRV